ncbi:MAG: hypothetical protein DYG92_04260 [Leptolyngbya sp. PLA1]|nr:hypothetical protein [Leptolyngbya sp. PLA1]
MKTMCRTLGVVAASALAPLAMADVIFHAQNRVTQVQTAADANLLSQSAPDFSGFVATLDADTGFTDLNQIFRRNRGRSSISCFIDFNAIVAAGNFTTQGGIRIGPGGDPENVFGEAMFLLDVTFELTAPTPFRALGSNLDMRHLPGDEFELEFENLSTGAEIFRFTDVNPIDTLDLSGDLLPGMYRLQYHTETSSIGDELSQDYSFQFLIPSPGAASLLMAAAAASGRRRRRQAF